MTLVKPALRVLRKDPGFTAVATNLRQKLPPATMHELKLTEKGLRKKSNCANPSAICTARLILRRVWRTRATTSARSISNWAITRRRGASWKPSLRLTRRPRFHTRISRWGS